MVTNTDIEKVMDIARLVADFGYGQQLERLKYIQENKEYMISFMGQFSAGKSRLINNLVGKEILPVHITETTALITFIKYDIDERVEIYYKNGDMKTMPVTDSVNLWQGNENVVLDEIESLVLYIDSNILKTGLVIADTPGINTVIAKHKELATEILKSSDKILYVLGKATTEEDIRFISKIIDYDLSIILVRTHMDELKQTEEDVDKTISSEGDYLKQYTDDKIFFLSNEPNSPFFKEIDKLREYIGNTLGKNIQDTINKTVAERLSFIAERLRELLSEQLSLLKDCQKNQADEFIKRKEEIGKSIDKLRHILNSNKERIKKQYNDDKERAVGDLQLIANKKESKAIELLEKQNYAENLERYTQTINNFLRDTYEEMYETYINSFDNMLGENKAILCQELGESCPQFEFEECIPEDIDSLSEKEDLIKEQLLQLKVQRDMYEREIAQIQADKTQNLEYMNVLEESAAQAKARYESICQELEQYPDYEPRYVVIQEESHEHEEIMRSIGNMLDWITVVIPGVGWVKAGSQVASAGSKILSKIPKTQKLVQSLNKTSKILNSSKKAAKIANNIDHTVDAIKIVRNIGGTTEEITNPETPQQKRRGLFTILDMLSFEYHFANFGKKFDKQQIADIDYEYESKYNQGKKDIENKMRQSALEEFQRRKEILDLDDQNKKAEMEEEISRRKQRQADEDIASLEKEIEISKQLKKKEFVQEYYRNQAIQDINEIKQDIQRDIADRLDKQLDEYIATVNISIMTKIKNKEQELDNISAIYQNASKEELENKIKELEDSIAYLDILIISKDKIKDIKYIDKLDI